jgi:hypothetical protein
MPLIFDVARIPRVSSSNWTLHAVDSLTAELGLSSGDLLNGIEIANRRRALLQRLDADRHVAGRYRERVARASLFTGAELLLLDRLPRHEHARSVRGQVVLAGSVPPDDGLHLAVEAAGWNVAGDVHARGLDRLGPPVDSGHEPPANRIARHAHARPRGPRGFNDRAAAITAVALERSADAAILWLFKEDEAFAWDVVSARQQLETAGIPTLVLERRQWDFSDAPEKDIARFLEELRP